MRRTKRPANQFTYWTYFLFCVLGLGGLGFWIELVQINGQVPANRDWNNTYTALVTFFPALIASSCWQMVFEVKSKPWHAFSLALLMLSLVVGLALISHARPASVAAWFWSVIACGASLWVWWIANADNQALHDGTDPDDAVGGNPDAPLVGNLTGIKI